MSYLSAVARLPRQSTRRSMRLFRAGASAAFSTTRAVSPSASSAQPAFLARTPAYVSIACRAGGEEQGLHQPAALRLNLQRYGLRNGLLQLRCVLRSQPVHESRRGRHQSRWNCRRRWRRQSMAIRHHASQFVRHPMVRLQRRRIRHLKGVSHQRSESGWISAARCSMLSTAISSPGQSPISTPARTTSARSAVCNYGPRNVQFELRVTY